MALGLVSKLAVNARFSLRFARKEKRPIGEFQQEEIDLNESQKEGDRQQNRPALDAAILRGVSAIRIYHPTTDTLS